MRRRLWHNLRAVAQKEHGYVLALVMLVLMAMAIMSSVLVTQISISQQHVARDRAYTQSLTVAEAGLNQYLWMVASGSSADMNDFKIPGDPTPDDRHHIYELTDPYNGEILGRYAMQVTPPSAADSRVTVRVTGMANSPTEVPRTIEAHLGRPAFSEYILLVDEQVYIGGPADRIWHGKTHSNTGIRIETAEIVDSITCALSSYEYTSGNRKPGIWSQNLPVNCPSKSYWHFPVPPIDFDIVTSDFSRLSSLAIGDANLPYVSGSGYLGWYIKLLPNQQYRVARVKKEVENRSIWNASTYDYGGTLETEPLSAARNYPPNGVIYVNDNVWIEGTGLHGRLTVASSGQLNSGQAGQKQTTINVVGDIIYAQKDGSAAVGLIAQKDIKIPMYAPWRKSCTASNRNQLNLDIDAALISQKGKEYVSYDSTGNASAWGPRRGTLTFYGSVSSFDTPYRRTDTRSDGHYAGFFEGVNTYDNFLLYNPPPHFPKVGTYQILDWTELPSSEAVPF
ncbi:MAG: hypothetical protein GX604_04925 [Actinobacteria bacterium]|nr:hypothetical protein [Actinomycetota bacterium]